MSTSRVACLWFAGAVVGLSLLAAGCGGSKSPSVANIGTTAAGVTTTATSTRLSTVALAACFGTHGLSAAVGSGSNATGRAVSVAGVVITGTDPGSAQFQAALQACRKDMPGGGPPSLAPAQQAEWDRAMTRFASCMRANGVPSFPDPNPGASAPFPAGSISNLDPGSPQVQTAFNACESREPKVGPRVGF